MGIRFFILGCALAACAPRPEPAPYFPVTGPAADTAFPVNTQAIVAEIAAAEHRDILK